MKNFGEAIEALKAGQRVSRVGWNGKGMWLFLTRPDVDPRDTHTLGLPVAQSICMKTATGEIVVGWLASQTDMLSADWCILDDPNQTKLPLV